jgi:hypothetical protein
LRLNDLSKGEPHAYPGLIVKDSYRRWLERNLMLHDYMRAHEETRKSTACTQLQFQPMV